MDKITKVMEDISSGITNFFKDLSSGKINLSTIKSTFNEKSYNPKRFFEINLVPDIKAAALKAVKIRNLLITGLIGVAGFMLISILMISIFIGSQNSTISNQIKEIESLDKKTREFSSLDEFLTMQGQISKLSELNANKKNLSRVFYILSSLLAQGPDENGNRDKITVSDAKVDIDNSVITIEGQADAGKEPFIDYRVLEAFKKNAIATNYDHGNYVDENGKNIPSRCVEESNGDGSLFIENGSIFGKWYKKEKGCDPSDTNHTISEQESAIQSEKQSQEILNQYLENVKTEDKNTEKSGDDKQKNDNSKDGKNSKVKESDKKTKAIKKRYNSEPVKIWRIPQFDEWERAGYINQDGLVKNIPHFEGKCLKYTKTTIGDNTTWQASNDCLLLAKPVEILDSSNARGNSGNLVLRFTARLHINPEFFKFSTKHAIPVTPTARNVTDSYLQVQSIFEKRASDCKSNDLHCKNSDKQKDKK